MIKEVCDIKQFILVDMISGDERRRRKGGKCG